MSIPAANEEETTVIDPHRAIAFVVVAFTIIAIPGPSVLFVISRGITFGRRAGWASAVGNNMGLWVHAVAVALGLGELLERSAAAFTVIKLLGAVYLIYLGLTAIRKRRALAEALSDASVPPRVHRVIREGFIVGATNPKAAILFGAILPQFVDPSRGHVTEQMLAFGMIAVAIALVSDTGWALLAGGARSWFGRSPRRLETLGGLGGTVMVGLGVRLALTGRHD